MKKRLLFFAMLIFACSAIFAQDTIAIWTFPSTSADSIVDGGQSMNSSRYLSCQYGTWGAPSYYSIPTDYTTNGSLGSPDKCGKTIGWDDAVDSAYWMVKFKTTGYGNLKLYSKQQAGGSNPGPKDFKAQYKLSGSTVWNDITGGIIVCANDWTTGVLDGVDLPSACDNQSSSVSVRWLITSNLDLNGNALVSSGLSKIDDIMITGTAITGIQESTINGILDIYPNPVVDKSFRFNCNEVIKEIKLFNIQGQLVESFSNLKLGQAISVQGVKQGIYFVQAVLEDGNSTSSQKLIIE